MFQAYIVQIGAFQGCLCEERLGIFQAYSLQDPNSSLVGNAFNVGNFQHLPTSLGLIALIALINSDQLPRSQEENDLACRVPCGWIAFFKGQ